MISDEIMAKAMEAFWDAPGSNEAGVRAALEAVLHESPCPQEARDDVVSGSFRLMLNRVALRFKDHNDPKVAETAKQCSELVNRLTKFNWRSEDDKQRNFPAATDK